ncbi:glycosyltransferase family 4 protein [Salinisphaera sp.]|uniref:glycosyltransferase family 4 protein n=1 Tax=Salinisphaera sp. TaxID=1914330 RepID=UPI000C3F2099|nr:glycosyltransferase family 4 protein [Salinisphaera sp.]MAS10009.1 glycosyltransferase family 1 protein [Salinisphaera sp.]MAS10496.1 glycosyltransferase family 1 protein [Salinisphaera sp.]|tara:strand:+ start:3880 stop:5064 length:1185 start_codon:yes stop_codon:yes gene_type:complete
MTSGDPPSSPQKSRTALLVANTDWYLFNFRLNLIKAAEHEGWHVQFAAPDTGYFQRLQTKGYRGHQVPLASAGLNPWHEFKALITLARTFRRVKPDVIHLFTLKCVLYGCLTAPLARRARVIGAVTGMGHLFTTKSWRTRLLKTPVLIALKAGLKISGAHLIFQNRADRDEFVDHRLIPRERTTVIRGSGVDCARFQPALQRRETNSTPRLLFCGRLIAEKGIHEYLAATKTLRDKGYVFESRIAGAPYPGNPSSLTEEEVRRLAENDEHTFLGHHEDMAALFAETDIVVLPTYREGTPKALLEATACGCIIVSTAIPGCEGIVDAGKNGALVSPRNAQAITDAVETLLDAPAEARQAMREHSRYIAETRFSDHEVNRKTLTLYNHATRANLRP